MMKRLQFIYFSFFLLFAFSGFGQDTSERSYNLNQSEKNSKLYAFPRFSVGFTPTALINYCPGVQFSLDIGSRTGSSNFSMEYAYIYADNFVSENDPDVPDSGFRIKLGYESMIKERNISVGGGFLMRNTKAGNSVEVEDQGFLREIEYDLERDVTGLYGTFKWHYRINNRINLRTGFLMGFSRMKIKRTEELGSEFALEDLINIILTSGVIETYQTPGSYFYPLLGLHLNVSYVISE